MEALKLCLENFGHKIISLKPIFAECPKLFQHRDKNVRGATRDLFVEGKIFHYVYKRPRSGFWAILSQKIPKKFSKIVKFF